MKFKSSKVIQNLYGYDFMPGRVVDVVEQNLCRKFMSYSFLEVQDGLQEQGQEASKARTRAPAKARAMTRSELKAEADELGISYKPQVRTRTLREQVTAHGYKD